tara:strand:- start:1425 stop:1673 length:249 start_codon:yes stop_codon:yes gene_type:complete
LKKGDLVKIKDIADKDLVKEGRLFGIIVEFDKYNPPREMRRNKNMLCLDASQGEKIANVFWSGKQDFGWVLQSRLKVIMHAK